MFKKFLYFLIVSLLIIPLVGFSQPETKKNNLSVESGFGVAVIDKSAGANLGLSLNYLSHKWGGKIRTLEQVGETKSSGKFFSMHFVTKYHYRENAILVSRLIKQTGNLRYVASMGAGSISQTNLEERFKNELGFAYDIGVYKTGKFFGYSTNFFGNVNGKAILIGVSILLTLNLSW